MTLILNTREEFAAQSLAGFVSANASRVRPGPGGVVRATRRRSGKVAVVIGSGSGHYPAFAGLVGTGLADGAVCGDVFASPSTRQVMDICRAVDQGAGVWLSFGNYAGDVLNFSAAGARLKAQGKGVEVLAVTDDVASAMAGEEHRRRGVAGDLVVFKIAGAAAEAGLDLEDVAAVAARANARCSVCRRRRSAGGSASTGSRESAKARCPLPTADCRRAGRRDGPESPRRGTR